jgi:hypothetical protein
MKEECSAHLVLQLLSEACSNLVGILGRAVGVRVWSHHSNGGIFRKTARLSRASKTGSKRYREIPSRSMDTELRLCCMQCNGIPYLVQWLTT